MSILFVYSIVVIIRNQDNSATVIGGIFLEVFSGIIDCAEQVRA
jgi:hypothetical protein